jgi:mannose/cellobiose epimerase-like protein (N-acyl-D-glucosamine 2-epimerase family)
MNTPPISWIDSSSHWHWLEQQSDALLAFYAANAVDYENGGFWWIDGNGKPIAAQGKRLWINARLTYAFAIGTLLGKPGYRKLLEHGIKYLETGPLRDNTNGGWFWSIGPTDGTTDHSKQSYGHAFVLLAAASAIIAGTDARRLFDDALDTLNDRFWDHDAEMFVDTWNEDFSELEPYRGQNANMHLVEALMTAAEVVDDPALIDKAVKIASRLIRQVTANNDWRLPEHFAPDWTFDPDFNKEDPDNLFRPYGSTIGHWLEWSRLLIQLNAASANEFPWMPEAAAHLFHWGIEDGWDETVSGFAFSTDWNGKVVNGDRYHWVIAESIGSAVALYRTTRDPVYAAWYQQFWEHAESFLIDPIDRSWTHQLDAHNNAASDAWDGKPDLYHALQATLFARIPTSGSLITNLAAGHIDRTTHA